MAKIIDSRNEWPYPAISDARKAGADDWIEISEEHANDQLGCVPPIFISGGFMVGEAADHTDQGEPIYTAVIRFGGRYFARQLPRSKGAEARDMLCAALGEAFKAAAS